MAVHNFCTLDCHLKQVKRCNCCNADKLAKGSELQRHGRGKEKGRGVQLGVGTESAAATWSLCASSSLLSSSGNEQTIKANGAARNNGDK